MPDEPPFLHPPSEDDLAPTAVAPLADSLEEGLETLFGFPGFREGQREAMETVLDGDDALVVMPTGAGKSLCYQLPALVADGVTLVISPLIALMKDQVDAMLAHSLPATHIDSSIGLDEQRERIDDLKHGEYKLVYVAPERFNSRMFQQALAQVEIGLLAIDEAHCVSQWGHDFRPDYLRLADVRHQLGDPPTLALTATATKFVQEDILKQLEMPEADIQVSGFERPNLFFEVCQTRSTDEKLDRIQALAGHHDGESVVVYCATRKQVEQVARDLEARDIDAGIYHGGMEGWKRERTQTSWMRDEMPVLVATKAFGMGVDKPDVRGIVHYNIPGSIEAYYQEAGRAGRDGEPANCLLLFNESDRGIHEFFRENSYPERSAVEAVWREVSGRGAGRHNMDGQSISDAVQRRGGDKVHPMGVDACLRLLYRGGHIDAGRGDRGPWVEVRDPTVPAERLNVDWEKLANRRDIARRQLQDVVGYATVRECRQARLLKYFEDEPEFGDHCGFCDQCCGDPEYVEEHQELLYETIPFGGEVDTLIKKLLAGVARAGGKRGTTTVAAMLRGSTAKKVRKAGFDELSTWGILDELRQDDLVSLLDMLAKFQLVRRGQDYGCLHLTELGGDVMTGRADPPEDLLAALERTLVKPSKVSRSSRSSGPSLPTGETYRRTHALLQDGLTYAEIAEQRDLSPRTILRHMMRLADTGERFPIGDPLDEALLEQLEELAADWSTEDPLTPLKDAIADEYGWDDLKLHLTAVLMGDDGLGG